MAERRTEEPSSAGRRWLRWAVVLVGLAVIGLATADALGAFKSVPYTAVPHGSHDHYVPDDCEDARTGDFPTRPPRQGERITCGGQIVSERGGERPDRTGKKRQDIRRQSEGNQP